MPSDRRLNLDEERRRLIFALSRLEGPGLSEVLARAGWPTAETKDRSILRVAQATAAQCESLVAAMIPPGGDALDGPIPEPPKGARSVLARLGVRTLRELLAVDPTAILRVDIVTSPPRVAELRRFQEEVRRRLAEGGGHGDPDRDDAIVGGLEIEDLPDEVLDAPLPKTPSVIQSLVEELGILSLRELAALDPSDLLPIRYLSGRTKVAALQDFRTTVLRSHGVDPPPWRLGPKLPTIPLELLRPLHTRKIYEAATLLAFDLDGPEAADLGPRLKKRLGDYQAAVREARRASRSAVPRPLAPEREDPRDLAHLLALALGSLDERTRDFVVRRSVRGFSLDEIAQRHGITRESVRQTLLKAMLRLSLRWGDRARELLTAQLWPALEGARVAHRERLPDLGLSLDELFLILGIAGDPDGRSWELDGDWLLAGYRLDDLDSLVEAALQGRIRVGPAELEGIAAEIQALSPFMVGRILTERLGWIADPGGVYTAVTKAAERRAWVERELALVGRPVHLGEVVRWLKQATLVADDVDPAVVTRSLEQILDRIPSIVRCGPGEFRHLTSFGFSEAQADEVVGWCVDQIRGQTGVVSTLVLHERLVEAGRDLPGLNAFVLKSLMKRHPEVRCLRKLHVAFDETFEEDGLLLSDRLKAILAEAPRPRGFEEIYDRLPEDAAYAETSVKQALYMIRWAQEEADDIAATDHDPGPGEDLLEEPDEPDEPSDGLDRKPWIEQRMLQAGRPVHGATMAEWLMDRHGVPLARRTPWVRRAWFRRAEKAMDEMACLYRSGQGEFQHIQALAGSQSALSAVVSWCVDQMVVGAEPLSFLALHRLVVEAGRSFEGLDVPTLKAGLIRHPLVAQVGRTHAQKLEIAPRPPRLGRPPGALIHRPPPRPPGVATPPSPPAPPEPPANETPAERILREARAFSWRNPGF